MTMRQTPDTMTFIKPFATHLRATLQTTLLMILLLASHTQAQELIANVDRETIGLNDTLTLTVRQTGRTLTGGPDFDGLRRDFDILSNQRSHQMRIVNGDMEGWTEWRLMLAPKRAGTLNIPAFEFGGSQSEPITVTVQERQQQPDSGGRDIFVETEVNKERIHVQEQVLFTVRLYSRVNLDGAEIQPLELKDAVIKPVNEENYITQIDGRQHIVLETTFALFPQRSGTLDIPSLVYELAVSRGQRDFWGRSSRQRVRTDALSVTVDPTPDQYSGDTWLPARNLQLSEHWGTDPDSLRQGEPVTRRITIQADGLTAAQLPALTLEETPGLTLYPDRPQTEEQVNAGGVQSTSTLTLAMVPNQSGRLEIPAVTLTWWDTEADQMRTAELPASTVNVTAIPGAAPASEVTPSRERENGEDATAPRPAASGSASLVTVILGIATALLSALSLWLAFLVWRLKTDLAAREAQSRGERDRARAARGRAWQGVKRAAKADDLHALRRALLDWGAALWPDVPPRGLTDLAERLDDDVARARLQELDAILFKGESDSPFDTAALLQALNQSRAGQRSGRTDTGGLKPLYPRS